MSRTRINRVSEEVLAKLRNDPRIKRLWDENADRRPCRGVSAAWFAEFPDGKFCAVEDIETLGGLDAICGPLEGTPGHARLRLIE
jgi:hypothetical protein